MTVSRYYDNANLAGGGAGPANMPASGQAGPWLSALSVIVALGLLAGAFMRYAFEVAPNHDNVWFLIVAGRLIDGGHYFTDFFALNPPLYIVLISPGLFIAEILGIDTYTGFIVWTLGLIGGTALLANRWLATLAGPASRLTPLLVAVYVGTLAWIPDYSFGQREHFLAILAFPYIIWLFRTTPASPIIMTPGLLATVGLAALGFFIKPHFLVIPVVLVAAHGIMFRQWGPLLKIHGLVFGVVGSVYAVVMVAAFPEWFDIAAIVLLVYHAYNPGLDLVLYLAGLNLLAAASIWIAAEMLIGTEKARVIGRVSFVAATALLLSVVLQQKAFPYHYLPAKLLNFLTVGIILTLAIPDARGLIDRITASSRYGPRQLIAGLMVVSLALSMALQVRLALMAHWSRAAIEAKPIYTNLAELATDKSVMMLSISLGPLSTASLLDLKWESRLAGHWMIPGILKLEREGREDAKRLEALKRLARRLVTEDLERYAPSLVAVYSGRHRRIPEALDLLSFYQADPAFAAQWSPYRQVRKDGDWRFYVRDAEPAAAPDPATQANGPPVDR